MLWLRFGWFAALFLKFCLRRGSLQRRRGQNLLLAKVINYDLDWTQFAGAWLFVGPWLFKTFLSVYRQIICLPFPIHEYH